MMPRALITGITGTTGQDLKLCCAALLDQGREVVGMALHVPLEEQGMVAADLDLLKRKCHGRNGLSQGPILASVGCEAMKLFWLSERMWRKHV